MLPFARSIFLLSSAQLSLTLSAALPELSSIEPIEFDEAAQRLVSRGDARLDYEGTRVQADQIAYYQEYGLADAIGSVEINRDGRRLIADEMSYDTQSNIFAVDVLRTGEWPYYVSAVTAGGDEETAEMEGATFYYGDPGPYTLNGTAQIATFDNEADTVTLEKTTFRVGPYPIFYLPKYTHHVDSPPYHVELNAGYDDEFGAYLQTTTLFPVTPWLRAGANLDFYTERGVLVGPTAQYLYNSEHQSIVGAFNSGYIHDNGDDLGNDVYGREINKDRGFVEWRHKHHIGERITLTASTSYWSDSEATRDFRDDIYSENRRPDNFVEGVYAGDNYFVSVFSRFTPNDFEFTQERLPEVSFEVLPIPIFNTGAYHRGSVSYARLSEDYSDIKDLYNSLYPPVDPDDSETDRIDATYRLERPILFADWLTFTPLAGARLTHYENQEFSFITPAPDDSYTRDIYEFGFDLEARMHAVYPTFNRTWDIDGLRHIVRPVVRYRYYTDPDSEGEIATIDRDAFDLNRPLLDLSDLRNTDVIEQQNFVRLGVENLFQTKSSNGGYGSRQLAALNFYQDVLFEKGTRFDDPTEEQDTFNATWVEFILTPAPWLKFDMASRFHTESLTLEELRTRTTIRSGEIWEIGLSTDLLNKRIDQYRVDFIYRLNERYSLLTDCRVDADGGDILSASVGLRTRLTSTWELIYAITFRDKTERESDVEFNIALRAFIL